MIYKVYGPPGTGKTTKLLGFVKSYTDKGIALDKIGYFAFTRKAAKEAKERIGIEKKKLRYFQTLHSFAFHALGLKEESVMQPYHYEDLGKQLNIRVKFQDKNNDEETHFLTCDNLYYQIIGKAKNKNITVEEEWHTNEYAREDINWDILKHININLEQYKQKNNLIDFNDMIHQFVNKPELCPEFEAVFIDEAQDLSPLQWQMYDLLKTKSKDIYLAGDDDQAIYQWAGADVDRFINEPGEEIFLTQSHRIPVSVQEISKTIINRIQGLRVDKKYLPREEQGEAKAIYNLHNVDLHKGNWLVLARTGTRLKDIMQDLESKGIYYQTKKGKSYGVKLYKAILNYTKWTNGLDLTENESKDIKDYTGDKVWSKDLFWYEIFDKVSLDQKNYIRLMLANKENLNDEARVKLSTIHAAKGGEEDNVVLILDNARKIRQAVQRSVKKRDEEHRVWYVGATRARNNLYLLKAKIERYGYQL